MEKELKQNKKETLEEAAERIFYGFGDITKPVVIKRAIELVKCQQERMYSDLSELRNDLYDKLPIGNVDAFEILKVINNHLKKLDALCGNK